MWGVFLLGAAVEGVEWGGDVKHNLEKRGQAKQGVEGWGVRSVCQLKQSNNKSYKTI